MDVDALIEEQVKLYLKVKDKIHALTNRPPVIEEAIEVFRSVHNWQMNKTIDKQQTARQEKREEKQDQPPTEKQLVYIEALGGNPNEFKSRREASAWIDAHRK